MEVFQLYSEYYDLLYKDKAYQQEVNYISSLIREYQDSAKDVLELGCGTGKHACLLASKGYHITGIDQSATMLESAEKRKQNLDVATRPHLSFQKGDICDIEINNSFDVVLSLFHVMSYLTTNDSLEKAFSTASKHLQPGGLFIFDCWYGPAVLSTIPDVRVKRMKSENIEVTRIAEPQMMYNQNVVEVHYDVMMKENGSSVTTTVKEMHEMRYLFKPEIEFFAQKSSFEILGAEEWLTRHAPSEKTWGVNFILRKTG